ncbi:MAG: hypothetical protein P9X24_10315 [Candidatus Hatepunaea meridiana]|nr:hypothetical protein [Candidatus Hatepunaea meridiana]
MNEVGINRKRIVGWRNLIGCIIMVWVFVFVIGPLCLKFDPVGEMAEHIRESGIEACGYWWSDVEVFADAEMNCRNTIKYPPGQNISKIK